MAKTSQIRLSTFRRHSGFSQRELAFLLQIMPATLSNFERFEKHPTARILLACEIIFGARMRDVFPYFYESVEAKIMRQASILFERLEKRQDEDSKAKCQLLLDMIQHTKPVHPGV